MRDPDALRALLDMAADCPLPSNRSGGSVDEIPSNREWLAMIEPAEEELLSSEDEDSDVSMMPEGLETAQSVEDGLALQDNSASPTPTAELNASQQSVQQLPLGLGVGGTAEAGVIAADGDDTHGSRDRVQTMDTPTARLPVHVVSLSESLTAAASATVTKPRRAKRSAPTPQSKYGRLLIDLRKPAPDIGPPPKVWPYTHAHAHTRTHTHTHTHTRTHTH